MDKNQEFVFTDVGAGDGKLTIPIINFLNKKTKLICNVIEPSDLIETFKKNCSINNVNYYKDKVENLKIPKSHFILASHLLVYLDNYKNTLKDLYQHLWEGGILLIVETNPKSDDVLLRSKLGEKFVKESLALKNLTLTKDLLSFLKTNDISHQYKLTLSEIDISECFKLSDEGKAIISFFFHESFESLTKKTILNVQNILNDLANKSKKLIKREDYIWIFKK